MRKLFLHLYLEMIFIEYSGSFRFMLRTVSCGDDEILGVMKISILAVLAGMDGLVVLETKNFIVTFNSHTIFTINMLAVIVAVANFGITMTAKVAVAAVEIAGITASLRATIKTDIEVHIDFVK